MPPAGYFFCLAKRSTQENASRGGAFHKAAPPRHPSLRGSGRRTAIWHRTNPATTVEARRYGCICLNAVGRDDLIPPQDCTAASAPHRLRRAPSEWLPFQGELSPEATERWGHPNRCAPTTVHAKFSLSPLRHGVPPCHLPLKGEALARPFILPQSKFGGRMLSAPTGASSYFTAMRSTPRPRSPSVPCPTRMRRAAPARSRACSPARSRPDVQDRPRSPPACAP